MAPVRIWCGGPERMSGLGLGTGGGRARFLCGSRSRGWPGTATPTRCPAGFGCALPGQGRVERVVAVEGGEDACEVEKEACGENDDGRAGIKDFDKGGRPPDP